MAESTGGTGLLMERITVPERRVSLLKILGRLLVNRELSLVLCCLITVAALLAAAADIIISTNGSPSDAEDGQIRFIFSPQTLIVSCGMILMLVSSVATSLNRLVRNRGQLTGIPRLKPLEDPPDKLNGLIHSQFSRINSQIRPLLSPNHHSTTTTSETDSSQSNVSLLTLNISIIQSFAVLETAVSAAVAAGRLKELLPINTIAAAESTALIRSQPSIANDQQTEAVMFRYKLISSGGCKPATWSADEYIGALQQLLNWDQRLTRYYMNVYRLARFSGRPLDPSLYRDAMKCLVILLKNVEK